MAKTPYTRIAIVEFPNGKEYVTRCPRADIVEGCQVSVLMHPYSAYPERVDGAVVAIQWERWQCKHVTDLLASEVPDFDLGEDYANFREKMHLQAQTRDEMRQIYDDLELGDGEDVYLSDGVWLTRSGALTAR
jgi:hypothetical protein